MNSWVLKAAHCSALESKAPPPHTWRTEIQRDRQFTIDRIRNNPAIKTVVYPLEVRVEWTVVRKANEEKVNKVN